MKLILLAISVCLLAVKVITAMPVAEQSNPVSDTVGEVPQRDVPLEKTSINVQDGPIKSSDSHSEEKPGSLENIALRKKSVDVQEGGGKVSEEPIVPAIPAAPAAESLNVKSEPLPETAGELQRNLPKSEASQPRQPVEPTKPHSEVEPSLGKIIELDDKKDSVLLNSETEKQKKEEELKEKEKLKTAASDAEKTIIAQDNQQPIVAAETPIVKQEEPLEVKSIVEHPVEAKQQPIPLIKAQEEQKQVSQQESMARKEENLPLVPEPSKVGVIEKKETIPAGEVLKKEVVPKESLGDKPDRVIREAEEAAKAAAKAAAAKAQDAVAVPISNQKPLEMSAEPVKPMEEKKKDMKEEKKQEDRATRGAQESEVSEVVSKKAVEAKVPQIETIESKEQVQQTLKSVEQAKPEAAAETQVKSVQPAEVKPQLKSEIQGEEKVAEKQQPVSQEGSKTLLEGAADSSEESSEEVKPLGETRKSTEIKDEKTSEEKYDKSSSEEKESKSVDTDSKPELLPKPEEVKDSKETIKLEGSSAAAALHSSSGSSSSSSLTSSSQQGVGENSSS